MQIVSTNLIRKTVLCLIVTVLTACNSSDKKITVTPPEANQSVESYIESQEFSGSVLVAKEEQIILSKGFGMANRSEQTPNTADTVFRIGSVSKQFTAVAILILEERGLLSLNDTVSDFIPDYPNGDKITLLQLLNMTSGIVNYTALNSFFSYKTTALSPLELIDKFKDEPMLFTPGEKFEYSNSNYVIAGYIIEKVANTTYANFIQTEIFNKVGMLDSAYGSDIIGTGNLAQGYNNDKAVSKISMTIPFAAGALVSTVNDLYKWHNALKNRQLLMDASMAKLYKVGLDGYALGWNVSTDKYGETFYQHGGGIDGFISYILRSEKTGYCIIVLANEEEFPSGNLAYNLMSLIAKN